MEFDITIRVYSKLYKMHVKRIYASDQMEKFEISGGGRYLVVRNNRPFLKGKGARHQKPEWKLVEGSINNASAFALTLLEMEKKIEDIDNPQPPWKHPKNN